MLRIGYRCITHNERRPENAASCRTLVFVMFSLCLLLRWSAAWRYVRVRDGFVRRLVTNIRLLTEGFLSDRTPCIRSRKFCSRPTPTLLHIRRLA